MLRACEEVDEGSDVVESCEVVDGPWVVVAISTSLLTLTLALLSVVAGAESDNVAVAPSDVIDEEGDFDLLFELELEDKCDDETEDEVAADFEIEIEEEGVDALLEDDLAVEIDFVEEVVVAPLADFVELVADELVDDLELTEDILLIPNTALALLEPRVVMVVVEFLSPQ